MSENKKDWDKKLNSALWAFRIAYKVSTGMTPFRLTYGLEAVVPMEYIVPSLRIAVEQKWSEQESLPFRIEGLMHLEQDRIQSAYVSTMIQNRRTAWMNKHMKKKVFQQGDKVLVYNSKLGKFPGKLKLQYSGPFLIDQDLGQVCSDSKI